MSVVFGLRAGVIGGLLVSLGVLVCVKTAYIMQPAAAMILVFNLTPLIGFLIRKKLQEKKSVRREAISEAKQSYEELAREDERIGAEIKSLESEVLNMARIYEITRAMSASMDFKGIFDVFNKVAGTGFHFKTGRIILGDAAYTISPNPEEGPGDDKADARQKPDEFDKRLIEFFVGRNQPLVIKPGHKGDSSRRLPVPEGASSFVAVPLKSEKKLAAVLHIEDINPEEIDRFLIVAGQFGLELEKVRLYEMVQELAIVDGLTGIFVRRHLLERFQDELRRSIKHKLNLSVLMIDIDRFKQCNDEHGHLVGDVVLKSIADTIKENMREVDLPGRYGGEEFCAILPDTDKKGGAHVAERLRAAVAKRAILAYDEKIKATISIGVATFPEDASDMAELIDKADQALYQAKRDGRNRVVAYE